MSEMIQEKITIGNLFYAAIGMLFIFIQQTVNYLAQLPDTTLLGIALCLAAFGGYLSWLQEVKKKANARLRTNVSFAIGAGIIAALLSYNKLVIEWEAAPVWLAIIFICGFSNQGIMKLAGIGARKKGMELLGLTDADMDKDDNPNNPKK